MPWRVTGAGYLEDHPRTCKWLVTTLYKPWGGHLEGVSNNPILRGRNRSPWLLSTYPSHGMILLVPFIPFPLKIAPPRWFWCAPNWSECLPPGFFVAGRQRCFFFVGRNSPRVLLKTRTEMPWLKNYSLKWWLLFGDWVVFFCGVKLSVIWQQIHLMYSRHELFVDKEATWCNMFVEVGSVFYLPK